MHRRYKDKLKAEAEQGNAQRYAAFKNRKQQQKARRFGNPRLLQQPTAAALLRFEQIKIRCANAYSAALGLHESWQKLVQREPDLSILCNQLPDLCVRVAKTCYH